MTRAVQMFTRFTGVQISEATARRHTYHRGQAALAVQNAQASLSPALTDSADPQEQLIVSGFRGHGATGGWTVGRG